MMYFESWLRETYGTTEPRQGWCSSCGEEDVELLADDRYRACLRYLQGYDEGEADARAQIREAFANVMPAA